MSPRHRRKRGGTVLHEGKPMRTTRHPCHSKMRSHAPSKPCLIATFLLRFLDQLLETLGIGSKRSAGHATFLLPVLGATAPGADGCPRDRWPHNPGLPASAVPHCECRMRLGAACDGAGQ